MLGEVVPVAGSITAALPCALPRFQVAEVYKGMKQRVCGRLVAQGRQRVNNRVVSVWGCGHSVWQDTQVPPDIQAGLYTASAGHALRCQVDRAGGVNLNWHRICGTSYYDHVCLRVR